MAVGNTRHLLLVPLVVVSLLGPALSGCVGNGQPGACTPGTAGCGGNPTDDGLDPRKRPPDWDALLAKQDYAQLIKLTTEYIDSTAPEVKAEAHLYRGLARLKLNQDAASVAADLAVAEKSKDQLNNVDVAKEQLLLFQGLAVSNAKLGNTGASIQYVQQANKIAPGVSQMSVIDAEFRGVANAVKNK